jgi:beta-glucanase (GH16 family)
MKISRWLAAIALAMTLAACGGGSSSASADVPGLIQVAKKISVSGVAIDGNLYKASVFLDLNGDGLLTFGEPTTITDESGSFTLIATQDQIDKNKVVVLAIAGKTIDQDNPNTTVASGYTLLAPAGSPSVVSPLTTQVVAKMDAGATLEQAKSSIQAELGLAAVDVMKNYVALKATDANYAKAHNVAASIAEVLKNIETDASPSSKLGDKLATLSSKVTTQVAPIVDAIKSASSPANAINIANISKTPKSVTVTSAIQALKDGASTMVYAVVTYTDNTTQNISSLVNWVVTKVSGDASGVVTKSSDSAVIKVNNAGLIDLVASYQGKASDPIRIQVACDAGAPSSNPFSSCAPAASAPAAPSTPTTITSNGKTYRLAWNDEFETPGLPDSAKWAYDTERNQLGWYNSEQQYYASARLQNSSVANGLLTITAIRERLNGMSDYSNQAFSSARLITKGKYSFTYGFVEVRAKLPCSLGTWPAIWMLGAGAGGWPDIGEIDIMEQGGVNASDKQTVLFTFHMRDHYGTGINQRITLSDACTAFHRYQLTWSVDKVQLGVDDNIYNTWVRPADYTNSNWPFDKPQYLLLNVAMGGTLGGNEVPAGFTSDNMLVDYVRVYQ